MRDGPPVTSSAVRRTGARRDALLVMVAAIGAALINYLLSLALIRILPAHELARYVALSGAALVVGTALGTGLPSAIGVAHARGDHSGADRFALRAALAAGAVVLPIVIAYGLAIAGTGGSIALAAATAAVVASAVSTGRMVGLERRRRLAGGRITEAIVRLAVGVAGGLLGGAPGAIAGIVAGTGLFAVLGLTLHAPEGGDAEHRELAGHAVLLSVTFGLTAAAGSLDVLVLPLLLGTTPTLGAYAATAIIARAPYFAAGAVAGAFYAPLAARQSAHDAHELARSAFLVALPGALLVASLPREVVDLLVPNAWALGPELLVALALAGLGSATFSVGVAMSAAAGRRRFALAIAVGGVVLGLALLAVTSRTSLVLAAGSLGATTLAVGVLGLLRDFRWRPAVLRGVLATLPVAAIAAIPVLVEPFVGRVLILWLAAAVVAGVLGIVNLVRHEQTA